MSHANVLEPSRVEGKVRDIVHCIGMRLINNYCTLTGTVSLTAYLSHSASVVGVLSDA